MADSRCFIQLHHPGWEHEPTCAEEWHSFAGDHGHQRKFLRLSGEWTDHGGESHSDELWAWGEWEADSDEIRTLRQPRGDWRRFPRSLLHPWYSLRSDYGNLHNTDPFIFGDRFLYSNCAQRRGALGPGKMLKQLDRGSVIVFGSCVSNEWVIDTVFVVAASADYRAGSMRQDFEGRVPQEFIDVTANPIVQNESPDLALRLYEGATPANPVHGMFSFFPARRAGGEEGFCRPSITLPTGYFNRKKCQNYKQTCGLPLEELRGLWDSLVQQVRDANLVLGTYAEPPERRDA